MSKILKCNDFVKEGLNSLVEYYPVYDCENDGDIISARREVESAGGIFDDVVSEDKGEGIDDYYEGRNWFIQFHCNTPEQFEKTCRKLGIYVRK